MRKPGGGNAHDRAKARIVKPNQGNNAAPIKILSKSGREWKQPLNRADSIGLASLLVGIVFAIIVPAVWYKAAALVIVCIGVIYLISLSSWTHDFKKSTRLILIAVILIALNIAAIPQLVKQWRLDHMRSELTFDASLPGLGYPDGDHYGINWKQSYSEVRLTVTSKAEFPIQNLNLSISATDQGPLLAGMAQTDSEPQGCAIIRPRFKTPPLILRGTNGSRVDVSPYTSDVDNAAMPLRSHYDILCQRIEAGESIPLVIGLLSPPSAIHIAGEYETTAIDGSKRVPVDEVVSVSRLKPWR